MPALTAGRGRLWSAGARIGAGRVPDTPGDPGRLAAARSAATTSAATAAMASGMPGVIGCVMARFPESDVRRPGAARGPAGHGPAL